MGETRRPINQAEASRRKRVSTWLWRYQDAKKDVLRYEEELKELLEAQNGAQEHGYSDMPKAKRESSDLSNYIVAQEKAVNRIEDARKERILVFQEIWNVIECLPYPVEREVVSYRYIRNMSWEQICEKIHREWSQTHRIHAKALYHIEEILKKIEPAWNDTETDVIM
jgi:DNA-directed RNA polymerase specialized sigma24 family protein